MPWHGALLWPARPHVHLAKLGGASGSRSVELAQRDGTSGRLGWAWQGAVVCWQGEGVGWRAAG